MKAILFLQDTEDVSNLYPFTLTRRIEDIRIGILTIREKWERILNLPSADNDDITSGYLISSGLLPAKDIIAAIRKLKPGSSLTSETGEVLAACVDEGIKRNRKQTQPANLQIAGAHKIKYPWHIFELNKQALVFDFELITKGRKSTPVDKTNSVSGSQNIFLEKGAIVRNCIINAEEGPVYIGKNALLMEGSCLRGPISIGEATVVKMGAKIYGATTVGPGCIVGGEIKNSVLFAHSNKAHDGYLGDSVIGEWCNLGAGTSNSNLKNTAGNIDVHLHGKKVQAGIKCGVLMGDFTRTAINTSINTGTVVGMSANVFGNGLTPKEIPSFSWGFTDQTKYKLDKALTDAHRWKLLKGQGLTEAEKEIFKKIYKTSKIILQ